MIPPRYKHQEEALEFGKATPRHINGDDMGLGKTREALDIAMALNKKRVLIVCPSHLKNVWAEQIELWYPGESYIVVNGNFLQREEQIKGAWKFTIINFELVGTITDREAFNDALESGMSKAQAKAISTEVRHLPTLVKVSWDGLIIDEAHRLKNRKSKAFEALKKIVRSGKGISMVIPMSGTIMVNKGDELWPNLHLVDPKRYSSFWAYANVYLNVIQTRWSPWPQIDVENSVRDIEALKAEIAPRFIRRTKDECLDLPEKTYVNVRVPMDERQKNMYSDMLKYQFAELESGEELEATGILAQITRLRQIAVSADLLEPTKLEIRGPKIDAVKELLEASGDQKVIIFSQFAQVINRLSINLLGNEYNLESITGTTERRSRTDYIKRFQEDPECKILLMTIGAGGTGITATAGSVVIFTDLTWSPAANAQAIGRMDRIGQTKPMTIYNIVSMGTIEEYVLKRLKAKEDLFNALINDIPEVSLIREYMGDTNAR